MFIGVGMIAHFDDYENVFYHESLRMMGESSDSYEFLARGTMPRPEIGHVSQGNKNKCCR